MVIIKKNLSLTIKNIKEAFMGGWVVNIELVL